MDTAPRKTFLRRVIVTLIVVVLAFSLGHLILAKLKSLAKEPERLTEGPPLPLVRVSATSLSDHREIVRGYGVARAYRRAHVAAEVGGIVRAISPRLEVGAEVRPPLSQANGDSEADDGVLVRIDRQDLEDALARLHAEREQALAEKRRAESEIASIGSQLEVADRRLSTARTELRRTVTLVESNTLAPSDADRQRLALFALEQMEAELTSRRATATASVEVIEARLGLLDASERRATRDLSRTNVYAPYAGRVSARHVDLGDLVAPGSPLFDLTDPATVEVAVALPAGKYGQVRVAGGDADAGGSRVVLRLGEGGEAVWTGSVARIDPGIDTESRTFRVYIVVEAEGDATPAVAPGAHVVGDVEGRLYPGVITIPREAFVEDRVFVASPTEDEDTWVARERTPTVVAVLSGLAVVQPASDDPDSPGVRPGERVVVTNLEDIADGSRFRVLESPSAE